ncbi:syntenin-1-like [Prorops nasuta]|uniref:syntenin-1-like n=1 Tax=Prorops nasuta TaxID=863751 RepID=UPI0034CE9504
MSLYPSLEDMKVDQMLKAQIQADSEIVPQPETILPSAPVYESPTHQLYPFLGEYMGLDLSQEVITLNMPEYAINHREQANINISTSTERLVNMVAPLSGDSLGLQRAQVTNGIREITLCKDKDGKIGLRVSAVDNGIFICLVTPNSPADFAGLRFGDQILDINGESVAGYSMDQVHKIFRSAGVNGIKVVVRDRPFERTVTMHKDSMGTIGFHFKNGKITALVKDSSAARNGLLTEHQILEVNGQTVVGMKDKQITKKIENGGNIITITVIPSYIYDHVVKRMGSNIFKGFWDNCDD